MTQVLIVFLFLSQYFLKALTFGLFSLDLKKKKVVWECYLENDQFKFVMIRTTLNGFESWRNVPICKAIKKC